MSNIQKHFKNKLSLHMASGGVLGGYQGFTGMTGGEGKLLEQSNQRLADVNSPSQPPTQGKTFEYTDDIYGMRKPLVDGSTPSPLEVSQFTNDPEVWNKAMDSRGPQRYLDYSPAPSFDPRNTPETLYQPRGQRRGLAQQPSTEWQAHKPLAPAFANGGFADIRGAGGPKDDEVPFEVGSGKDKIQGRVANGEKLAVIPSEMAQNPEAMEGLAQTMEAHTGKKPVGLREGFAAATGALGDQLNPADLRPEFRSAAQTPVIQPAVNAGLEAARDGRALGAQAASAQQQAAIDSRIVAQRQAGVSAQQAAIDGSVGAEQARRAEKATMHERLADPRITSQPLMKPGQVPLEYTPTAVPQAAPQAPAGLQLAEGSSIDYTKTSAKAPPTGNSIARAEELRTKMGIEPGQTKPSLKLVDPVPVAQPAPAPAPAAPMARGEQLGRNAAKVYKNAGGATGILGKAANVLVPAAAAFDTMGEDGIRVEGNREGDPTNESAGGLTRVANAAKEVGLRAGDWGTKGADMLMDIPLWAANKVGATSGGKPLEYGLINKNYRQGMRDANLAGVTIPQSAPEREMTDAKALVDAQAESKAMHKKYANKNGNMGAVVDQSAIDALKAADAGKAKAVTLEAATKSGNTPGQNHLPEAVTVQDQAASDTFGNLVDKATGSSRSGDGGLRGMAQRMNSYATNDTVREARNAQLKMRGDGARYEKDSNGKLTITNSGDFDGSTKMQYTGADGKPTAVFKGSDENKRGISDAQGLRNQLTNIEQMNLKRNAGEDITDIGLRNYSRATIAQQNAQQAKLNETLLSKQPSALDIEKHNLEKQRFAHELQKTQNLQGNNIRDYKAGRSDIVNKRVDDMLNIHAPTTGLKDEALVTAQARRADMQEAMYSMFGESMPQDDATLNKSMPQMITQAKTSLAIRDAIKNRGLWNKIGNIGSDPWTTLHGAKLHEDGKNIRFSNGFTIPIDDIVKDGNAKSADIYNALKSRTQ